MRPFAKLAVTVAGNLSVRGEQMAQLRPPYVSKCSARRDDSDVKKLAGGDPWFFSSASGSEQSEDLV